MHSSGFGVKKSNESTRLVITTILGLAFGFFIGISFPNISGGKISLRSGIYSVNEAISEDGSDKSKSSQIRGRMDTSQIYVATNPRGAELLPPGIVVSETDLYLRRLWGDPNEDLKIKPKNTDSIFIPCKFSENFTIVLFHYDGRVSEWDEFEWSKRAIHFSARKQTKWYAKRFLHPDVVAAYDYIFIWDEDLGVEHFNAEKYLQLVKKHGLEISQPGLEPNKGLTWEMTKKRGDSEVHKMLLVGPCTEKHKRKKDGVLIHTCHRVQRIAVSARPHEKIGVVDSQWIVHQVIPSLGNQGQPEQGKAPWEGVRLQQVVIVHLWHYMEEKAVESVRLRCRSEWELFKNRLTDADRAYFEGARRE
ncbi:hypothetical protein ACLOJK_011524 [Asimina triloba]